jgi:RHS repeat-associated protein
MSLIKLKANSENTNTEELLPRVGEVGRGLKKVTDYYPFGLEIHISGSSNNQLKYNSKELQTEAGLGWYDYGARFYDPQIGRWHTIDPAIENNHHNFTPYAYVYNNPIKLIDPFGIDSIQRNKAIDMANKIVDANPNKDPKLYDPNGEGKNGAKGDEPGEAMDCSGMGANWRKAGDEPNPVSNKKSISAAEKKFGKGKTEGVKQLAATAETVDQSKIEPGNEVYFNNYGHVGLVTKVNKNDNGNPTSIEFQHSGSSTGPTTGTANLNGTGYWGSRISAFGKWDTKPDNVKSVVTPLNILSKYVKNYY